MQSNEGWDLVGWIAILCGAVCCFGAFAQWFDGNGLKSVIPAIGGAGLFSFAGLCFLVKSKS